MTKSEELKEEIARLFLLSDEELDEFIKGPNPKFLRLLAARMRENIMAKSLDDFVMAILRGVDNNQKHKT